MRALRGRDLWPITHIVTLNLVQGPSIPTSQWARRRDGCWNAVTACPSNKFSMTHLVNIAVNRRVPQLVGFAVAAAILIADQATKWAMLSPLHLRDVGQIVLLPIFNFTFTENTGVSLGLLGAGSGGERWVLVALTVAIAVTVLIWLLRERRAADTAALGLILGGALGNIRDRATLGYVVDWADLHFGSFRPFLIFNLADAAITCGVLIILARSFLSREKRGGSALPPDTAPRN